MIACKPQKEQTLPYVESPSFTLSNSTIDQITKQDIYEKLYEIYQIRREAIEGQIRSSLLSHHKEISNNPIDSIINEYNIHINLKEPAAPLIPIKDEYIHWMGNMHSKSSIIEFVNPECDLCHFVVQRINNLSKSLKDKVKIGYVIYSNESTLSAQALLYASHNNKFSELFDDFMSSPLPLDSTTIYSKMMKHNLDTASFYKNTAILQVKCLNQNIYLREQGISKTPSILINKRLTYNPLDTVNIKKKIYQNN